ncbi:MAG: GGDEF domain-containing protein [Marinicaulis sp.]|nr:GGDEF domain-containing protein [Marinicaulis sp.]
MSALHPKTTPAELGIDTLNDLKKMAISPFPTHYAVWFSHLEKANSQLSTEIERRVNTGAHISDKFLEEVYERYFPTPDAGPDVSEYINELLDQTNTVQQISNSLHSNTELLQEGLTDATVRAETECQTPAGAETFVASLISTAKNAIERNEALERDLIEASSTIVRLKSDVEAMAKDANTDFLTKISNRRHFYKELARLIKAAHYDNSELCVVICDVDHFKKFNDSYGHDVGDQVLVLVAAILRDNVKGQDVVARYGGEEFAIILPNTSQKDAVNLANTIREAISRRKLVDRATNEPLGSITMSFGVARLSPISSSESIIKDADAALYDAKRAGRNRVRY